MTHAIRVTRAGGPEVLEWQEVPDPEPGAEDVVVDVHAAGVNFIDTYHRSGLYEQALPFTPGLEGAGTVASVGPAVAGVEPGDRVAWTGAMGSYAGRHVVPASQVLKVPDEMELETAAALPLQGMTAYYLATSTFPLESRQRCLIHAAAGGTGRLLVQIAKRRGAEVVATVGSEEKAELARSAGADHVIDYTTTDLVAGVEAAVGRAAIDVVYDGVGASTFDAGLSVLKPRGTMVTFGNASGPVGPIAPLRLMPKSLFLTRPSLMDYISGPGELRARWEDLGRWLAEGSLDVRIGLVLPMAEAAEAHRRLESRSTTGKILLTA